MTLTERPEGRAQVAMERSGHEDSVKGETRSFEVGAGGERDGMSLMGARNGRKGRVTGSWGTSVQ